MSNVDATKPLAGVPAVKSDLRNNLQTIKTELEVFEGLVGVPRQITSASTTLTAANYGDFLKVFSANVTIILPTVGDLRASGFNFSPGDITVGTKTVPTLHRFDIDVSGVQASVTVTADVDDATVLPLSDASPLIADSADDTKRARIDVGAVAPGETRVLTMPDRDVDLGNVSAPFSDTTALVRADADPTKLVRFDAAALATATTRTVALPDSDLDLYRYANMKVFDVTDPQFAGGAKGDGINDDQPAIQAAIDAVTAQGPFGAGKVFFPAPSAFYRVNNPYIVDGTTTALEAIYSGALKVVTGETVASVSTWQGTIIFEGEEGAMPILKMFRHDGADLTTEFQFRTLGLTFPSSYRGAMIIVSSRHTDPGDGLRARTIIRNLRLDGGITGAYQSNNTFPSLDGNGWDLSHKGVVWTGWNDLVQIEHIDIFGFRGEILYSGANIDKCVVLDSRIGGTNGNGCNIQNCRKFFFWRNEVYDCANDAFEDPQAGFVDVRANVFDNTGNVAIGRSNSSSGINLPDFVRGQVNFVNNYVSNGEHGGIWSLAHNLHIEGNTFYNCQQKVIRLDFAIDGTSGWERERFGVSVKNNMIIQRDVSAAAGISFWNPSQTNRTESVDVDGNKMFVLEAGTGTITSAFDLSVYDSGHDIVITGNKIGRNVTNLVTMQSGSFAALNLIPAMMDNYYYGETPGAYTTMEIYNSAEFTTGSVGVIMLGRVVLQPNVPDLSPTFDPTKYTKGTQVEMTGNGTAAGTPAVLPKDSTLFFCKSERFLFPQVHVSLKFDGNRFVEYHYDDRRAIRVSNIGSGTVVDAKGYDRATFNTGPAQTYTSHAHVSEGMTIELTCLQGNTTLANNAAIDTGTGADLLMTQNRIYMARKGANGVLYVLNG